MHAGLLKGRLWLAIPIDLEKLIVHIKSPNVNTLPFMVSNWSHNINCISHSGYTTWCNPFMQMSGYKGCLEFCTSLSLPVSL